MKSRHSWSIVALVLVVTAIALYLNSHRQLFSAFQNISFPDVLFLAALCLLLLMTSGLALRVFACKVGVRLTPKEWFGLSVVSTMTNYIAPFSSGSIARASYLNRCHNFPYRQFIAFIGSNYLVTAWVAGVVGVVTLLSLFATGFFSWQITIWFVIVTVGTSVLAKLPSVTLPWKSRPTEALNASFQDWALVKDDRALIARLMTYALVNILVNGLSFWTAYKALGSPISFTVALLIAVLALLSGLVNLTPGNLGIQEAVVSFSSGLLGTGIGQGLLVTLLIRAVSMVVIFGLAPLFSFLLAQELSRVIRSKETRDSAFETDIQ